MKIYSFVLIVLIFFLQACKAKKNLNDLKERNSLYYIGESIEPYSGVTYSKDTNLKGQVFTSTVYEFRDGVVQGKWKSFGYEHETLQSGIFIPVFKFEDLNLLFPSLSRINLSKYKEGAANVIDIYLISTNIAIDSVGLNQKKEAVIQFLVKEKFLNERERPYINSYGIYTGEFQDYFATRLSNSN